MQPNTGAEGSGATLKKKKEQGLDTQNYHNAMAKFGAWSIFT